MAKKLNIITSIFYALIGIFLILSFNKKAYVSKIHIFIFLIIIVLFLINLISWTTRKNKEENNKYLEIMTFLALVDLLLCVIFKPLIPLIL